MYSECDIYSKFSFSVTYHLQTPRATEATRKMHAFTDMELVYDNYTSGTS